MSDPPEKVVELPLPRTTNNSHDESWLKRKTDERVQGNTAPVQQTKVIISERGAMILAVVLAAGIAGWAASRVASLEDHIAENQRITQMMLDNDRTARENERRQIDTEIDHYKEEFAKLDRQSRMTELKLDDTTVVLHRAGLQLPGDYTRGPQGALDAESFHIQKPKGKAP